MDRYMKPLYILLFCALLMVPACRRPDAGTVVEIDRIDRLWTPDADTSQTAVLAAVSDLCSRYADFAPMYLERLLGVSPLDTAAFVGRYRMFARDSLVRMLYRKVQAVYPGLDRESRALAAAGRRYLSAFPDDTWPQPVAVVSGLDASVMTSDRVLGLALDKYLGADEPLYRQLGYAAYQLRRMTPEALVPEAVRAWIYASHPMARQTGTLLEAMVYEGKVACAVAYCCPSVPDSVLFGFSDAQIRWCREARAAVWDVLVREEMLYITGEASVRRMLAPAPFASRFSAEAPGQLLCWVGYDLVRSYLRRHRKCSMQELFALDDAQEILREARYRP